MDLSYSWFNVLEESEVVGRVGQDEKQLSSTTTTAATQHQQQQQLNNQKGSWLFVAGGGLFISAISPTDKYTQVNRE